MMRQNKENERLKKQIEQLNALKKESEEEGKQDTDKYL